MRARLIPGALAVVALIAALILHAEVGELDANGLMFHMAAVLPNVVVGGIILVRRGGHLVGWIFTLAGLSWGLGIAVEAYARYELASGSGSLPSPGLFASVIEWCWLAYLASLLFLLPQVFPRGTPLPGRFAWIWRATIVWTGSFVLLGALESEIELPGSETVLINPIGISGLRDVEEGAIGIVLFAGALALVVSSLTALLTRFRRSRGEERQQLKWFTFAGVLMLVGFVGQGILDEVAGGRLPFVDPILLSAPPICAGVAIPRANEPRRPIERFSRRRAQHGEPRARIALASLDGAGSMKATALARPGTAWPSVVRALASGLVAVVDRTMARTHVSLWISPERPT
ncbi:MAG: hypothetical protein ACRDJ2_13830 [Actinomycetota bacterium]